LPSFSVIEVKKAYLAISVKCDNPNLREWLSNHGHYDEDKNIFYIPPYKLTDFLSYAEKYGEEIVLKINTDFSARLNFGAIAFSLRDYQMEIVNELRKRNYRGIVILPTGAGKTYIALKAIHDLHMRALIIVPTIDLLYQWRDKIKKYLGVPDEKIGIYGGGEKEINEITIATYQGASKQDFLQRTMDYFGLIIFDEVHHLAAQKFSEIARRSIAPHRIGLTATLEVSSEEKFDTLRELVGEIMQTKELSNLILEGYLTDFDYKLIYVKMKKSEQERYRKLIRTYKEFLSSENIALRGKDAYMYVLRKARSDPYARKALIAITKARELALFPNQKLLMLDKLLRKHGSDKVIIFTRHVKTANLISYLFGIPKISHDTPKDLRKRILELFRQGEITKIVSAEALDEGIDVPDASVCIIISGRASSRQFIQRIGRVLRPKKGKRAIVYELVTSATLEEGIARRRKEGL